MDWDPDESLPYNGSISVQQWLCRQLQSSFYCFVAEIYVYIWAWEITPNASLFTLKKRGAGVCKYALLTHKRAGVRKTWRRCPEDLAQVSGDLARKRAGVRRPGAGVRKYAIPYKNNENLTMAWLALVLIAAHDKIPS